MFRLIAETRRQDYAVPLRSFARKRETAIIPQFEASHLFINIEQLVPIAEGFEKDLRLIDEDMRRDRSRLPPRFGETILSHVSLFSPRPVSRLTTGCR